MRAFILAFRLSHFAVMPPIRPSTMALPLLAAPAGKVSKKAQISPQCIVSMPRGVHEKSSFRSSQKASAGAWHCAHNPLNHAATPSQFL
ncbi:hypothetical protein D3C72_2288910 [compost metagenome]